MATLLTITAHLSAAILAGRKLEDADVRHGQPAAGTSGRDVDESEVCDEGAQHSHWDGQAADAGS